MEEAFLHKKLNERLEQDAYRRLHLPDGKIDFCSNDYLGIVKNKLLETMPGGIRAASDHPHGSTGSRLLAGNYALIEETEKMIARFHDAEAGLIFNSGYDANLGLLSAIPQRGDTIIYDQLSHASIRDGIRLSFAQSFSFRHNSAGDLEEKLRAARGNIFVVTESVFSMDGDLAPLREISALCEDHGAHLIVDEAHATGIIGKKGEGLMQDLQQHRKCFARVHTFGKAVGCHGAIVLGTATLRDYLINFSRPFIYTTALPETSVAAIRQAYEIFPELDRERSHLNGLIQYFRESSVSYERLASFTPIQPLIIPGNAEARALAWKLQDKNLDIRPVLYPTVPKGSERLRIVLHSFNTREEVDQLIHALQ